MAQLVKNLLTNAGYSRDVSSTPGSGRTPGGGNGNPFQYSCMENSMDREARGSASHGVTKSRTWLSSCTHTQEWAKGEFI